MSNLYKIKRVYLFLGQPDYTCLKKLNICTAIVFKIIMKLWINGYSQLPSCEQ